MKRQVRALVVFLPLLLTACSTSSDSPDLVLLNGIVYTVDEAQPWAEAIAISGEYITAVGSVAEIQGLAGSDTRTIDLNGAFVTAGFNDAHVHVSSTGALIVGVNLLDVHEPVAFADRIQTATERLPLGSLISGGSWGAYEQWGEGSAGETKTDEVAEPFTPHRDLLDGFSPNHPVLVSRFDRSMHLANSRALELAGINANTLDPAGGEFVRDESGRLTGILKGSAYTEVRRAMPSKSFEQRMIEFEAVQKEARLGGVTTIQDLTSPEMLRVYQETRNRGNLTVRVMLRPTLYNVKHIGALGITKGFGDDYLKFVGYKAWVDGIMGGSSALFYESYDHMSDHFGNLRTIMFPEGQLGAGMSMTKSQKYTDFPAGNLEKLLQAAVPTGLPAHVHAIGDKGVRILLDIYDKVLTENELVDSDHRWRMIHAQVVHPDDFHRFGELNLVAEVNPYHVSDDMRWMEERIGADRSKGAYAFRTLKENGAVLIFGSDSPGTNAARYFLNPKYGLYAAVSRQTLSGEPLEGWFPDQRLTIEEAIEAYTRTSAWATFEEAFKGTITPGKLADIAVFNTNLIDLGHNDPSALLDAEVLFTIVGGRIVYEAGQ
ncbi:MAG: amidohydrolase [Bacteroidetes bacterium]|nr:amidohydrolase [Bacteroidota bacterium]